jgi:pimeloyl-ACP methyl ester carboxylesterase
MMNNLSLKKSGSIEYFEQKGEDEIEVVLLHGIGSNALSFKSLIKELPQSWRILAWNAPGYGQSKPLDKNWPIADDYALALQGLYERLELRTPLLVGHSLGALIATSFALRYSKNVSKLLLASPALGHGQSTNDPLNPLAKNRIDELELYGVEKFALKRASKLVANPDKNPKIVSQVAKEMMHIKNPGYTQAVKMLASGDLLQDALKVSCPTDVVVGAKDIVTTPASAKKVFQVLQSVVCSKLTQLNETGHAIYQQSPTNFAKALKAFAQPNLLTNSKRIKL